MNDQKFNPFRRKSRKKEKQFYWVYYRVPHTYRGDTEKLRENTKKVEIPAEAIDVTWDSEPKVRTNKQGNKVYGPMVTYRKKVSTRGGGSAVKKFSRIVQIPDEAEDVHVSKKPPKHYRRYLS